MADKDVSSEAEAGGFRRYRERLSPRAQLIVAGGGLVALVLAWYFVTALLPRWWAHRVGDVARGRLWVGSLTGLAVGFVCTLVPLAVVALAWSSRRSRTQRLVIAAVALVLALPNLTTLGIVIGRGGGAHAGERTLDVDAPGFRGGSLIGVIAAVALAVALRAARSRRGRRHAQAMP